MRRLLALAIIAAASHPSASPKSAPSWSAASGARLAAWVARAANCSFDARRVALLVAVHPPKYEEAFALLKSSTAWNSNLQPEFNVRVFECFYASASAVLRELDASNRSVQKSAESTSI